MTKYNVDIKTGDRFDRVVVSGPRFLVRDSRGVRRSWFVCRCDCGAYISHSLVSLRTKKKLSCGCPRPKPVKPSNRHGLSNTPLHMVWKNMRRSCYTRTYLRYKEVGGKGIIVCDEWHDYKVFHQWAMASGYKDGLWLTRLDKSGNFTPKNCYFETPKSVLDEAGVGMKANIYLTAYGEAKTLKQWSEDSRCGLDRILLYQRRFLLGWTDEEAVRTPVGVKRVARATK